MPIKHLKVRDHLAFWGDETFSITHGRGGIREDKVEGDGSTPVGVFPFRKVFFRKDRVGAIETSLPFQEIQKDDGWCDDPLDPLYNQYVKRPYPGQHEEMWREDHLYDIVIVIGHNDDPIVPHKGSAVFIHLKSESGKPTEGCIGLEKEALLQVLKEATLESCLIVEASLAHKENDHV